MNLPPEGHKCFVRIGNANFQVRIEGSNRMVYYDGAWRDHDKFIDMLAEDGEYSTLVELAKVGRAIARGEA